MNEEKTLREEIAEIKATLKKMKECVQRIERTYERNL